MGGLRGEGREMGEGVYFEPFGFVAVFGNHGCEVGRLTV